MMAKVDSYEAYLAHLSHFADSCTYGWLLEPEMFDRIVVIERDPEEVADSLEAATGDERCQGIDWAEASAHLRDIYALRVPFDDLNANLPRIHAFLELPVPFNPLLTREMCDLNVQMDFDSFAGNVERAISNIREALE